MALELESRTVDLDGFDKVVEAQLQYAQQVIIAEHRSHCAMLQDEIDRLRGVVHGIQSSSPESPPSQSSNHNSRFLDVVDIDLQDSSDLKAGDDSEGGVEEDEDGKNEESRLAFTKQKSPTSSSHSINSDKGKDELRSRTVNLFENPEKTPTQPKQHKGLNFDFHVAAEDRNFVQRLVLSHPFELISGAVILANTVIIALQLQYDGFDLGYGVEWPGSQTASKTWPGAETAFFVCNVIFNVLFTVELFLRLAAHGWRSILSGWMWFDTIVVSVGVVDLFAQDALAFNPGMMRVIRLVRLVRLLKIFETMNSFDSLFLLLKALHASRQALIWSFLILGMMQLMVGLFLCQILQDYLSDESVDKKARAEVFEFFGTFSRTMLTMFEITMANWLPSCRALVDNVNEFFILFYILYRCMCCFAILKVIAAVFITETNRVLENDDELTIMKHNREQAAFRSKLVKTFDRIDTTKSGFLHWQQLDKLISDDSLASEITTLGFQIHDLQKLFWLLDDGSGRIHINHFLAKMGRLKGQSKQIDVLSMMKLVHKMDNKIEELLENQGINTQTALDKAEEDLACQL